MLRNRLIICIASSWDYDPTSKHHIMKILSRENQILWINYHGSRRPDFSGTDFHDSYATLRRIAQGIRRVGPSITQVTPMVIPGATAAPLRWLHKRMLIAQIRRAIRAIDPDGTLPVQVWSFAPDVPYLVGAFNEECFVYYCVDEFSQFEGYASDRILAAERELVDNADIVITSSEPLLEAKRHRRPDAVLVRHGVDFDHFSSAWRAPQRPPADLAAIPRPIFGYFGLIHHWVDLDLLAEVARLRPLYSFVLIGECKVNTAKLAGLGNVFFFGRRAYEDLPAYCTAFDGAMMLFMGTPMTRNVNPIKMYEYLAAGVPIVSTPLPEAQRFEGPIKIAETAKGFAEACDGVLATQEDTDPEAISRFVVDQTWEAKVEHLSNLIMAKTNPSAHVASRPVSEIGPWPLPVTAPIPATRAPELTEV